MDIVLTNLGAPGSGVCICQQATAQYTLNFNLNESPLLVFNLCTDCKAKLTTAVSAA